MVANQVTLIDNGIKEVTKARNQSYTVEALFILFQQVECFEKQTFISYNTFDPKKMQ